MRRQEHERHCPNFHKYVYNEFYMLLTKLQVLPALLPATQQRIPLVGELQQLVLDVGGRVVLPRQQLAAQGDARREVVLAGVDLRLQRLVVVH